MDKNLIAPCGMNCALCISYQSGQLDLNSQGFRRKTCPGCRPRGKNCLFMASSCDLVGQGKVRFCFECGQYPCKRLKALDKRYRTRYHMSMIDNLNSIRQQGLDDFIHDQESDWRCAACGQLVCCHIGLCLACDLDTLKQRRTYRWGYDKSDKEHSKD